MKTYISLFICAALSLAMQAKGNEAGTGREFAPVGAVWYYEYSGAEIMHGGSFAKYECTKDTMIEGFALRKIERTYLHPMPI